MWEKSVWMFEFCNFWFLCSTSKIHSCQSNNIMKDVIQLVEIFQKWIVKRQLSKTWRSKLHFLQLTTISHVGLHFFYSSEISCNLHGFGLGYNPNMRLRQIQVTVAIKLSNKQTKWCIRMNFRSSWNMFALFVSIIHMPLGPSGLAYSFQNKYE